MATPGLSPAFATRRGKEFLVPRSGSLPPTCLKCGSAATTPWRRKFYWHNRWIFLLILLNILIYAIVALTVRKKMELNLPLCDAHHSDRKRYRLLGILMFIGALPLGLVLGFNVSEPLGWITGIAMFIAAVVFSQLALLGVGATKIDDWGGSFRGACQQFLSQLPEQPI